MNKALILSLLLASSLPASPTSDLLMGAQKGQVSRVKAAIENGARLDAADAAGETALIKAAKAGKATVVKFLVEQGADPSLLDKTGKSARDWAQDKGHTLVLKLLPQAKAAGALAESEATPKPTPEPTPKPRKARAQAEPEATGSPALDQELAEAVEANDLQRAAQALKQGADPNQLLQGPKLALKDAAESVPKLYALEGKDYEGYARANPGTWAALMANKFYPSTLLNQAIEAGNGKLVKLLLKAGADPNLGNSYHQGALGAAFDAGHPEYSDDLIAAGARASGLGFMGYFDQVNVPKQNALGMGGFYAGYQIHTPKLYSDLAAASKAGGGSFQGDSAYPYFGFKINSYIGFYFGTRKANGSALVTAEGPSGSSVKSLRAYEANGMDIGIIDAEIPLKGPWEDWGPWELYLPLQMGVAGSSFVLTPRYNTGIVETSADGSWYSGYGGAGIGLRYCAAQPLLVNLSVSYLMSFMGDQDSLLPDELNVVKNDYGGLSVRLGAYFLLW